MMGDRKRLCIRMELKEIMDISGIEPEASSMPRKRSTPDLYAHQKTTF